MSYKKDRDGIFKSSKLIIHNNSEYLESDFKILKEMQDKHFWYSGRHSLINTILKKYRNANHKEFIDLGGGTGGWINYLSSFNELNNCQIALGDSSVVALKISQKILDEKVDLYHIDLMSLEWKNKWDIIFLLDVIEHCPSDEHIFNQIYEALKPGGLLIVTTPALDILWSYNDVLAQHLRRYKKSDYVKLANGSNFKLIETRYFMFFLSPIYLITRIFIPFLTSGKFNQNITKSEHNVPNKLINYLLTKIFFIENYLSKFINYPFGTSILGVFKK